MNAVDTNVFVYAFDDNDPGKQAKAHALIGRLLQQPSETLLLWQALGELLACLRKWESAGRITAADVEAHFKDVLAMFPLSVPTTSVFQISFDLR